MKKFLELVEEKESKLKPVVMAFGRMNPPTAGHEKLVNKVKELADKHKAHHHIVLSHSQDTKKNPLSAEDKVKHARRSFPGANISAASKEHPTFMHHAKKLSDAGHKHLIMVAGEDRAKEYHDLLHKYNGKEGHHKFDKIEVVSSGKRDPKASGTEGVSATKMREHAKSGNYGEFKKGLSSHLKDHHAKALYKEVRKGMGINEQADRGRFKCIFVVGGPGSGKDIIIREGVPEMKVVELNAVQAFDYLMDKQKLSEQSKDFRREAIRNRVPLVINGTADNFDRIGTIKEELEELGYVTMMVYVDTTNDTSKQRNESLKRMFAESVRAEKWQKSQVNKTKFYQMFEDFNLFQNNDNIEVVEESITDVYDHVNEFLDRKVSNEISHDWLLRNGKLDINEEVNKLIKETDNVQSTIPKNYRTVQKQHNRFLKDNRNPGQQFARKEGKIDSVKDGDLSQNSGYTWRTYTEGQSEPTLKASPEPKEPRFQQDKEKIKAGKSRWKWNRQASGSIKTPGVGPEFDTRQQGTVYPMSGLGDVTYRESVEPVKDKYQKDGTAEGPRKSFSKFRTKSDGLKEAIDDPGAVDMGVGGVLGGASNKEPMQTPMDKFGLAGITIEKKKKRKKQEK